MRIIIVYLNYNLQTDMKSMCCTIKRLFTTNLQKKSKRKAQHVHDSLIIFLFYYSKEL